MIAAQAAYEVGDLVKLRYKGAEPFVLLTWRSRTGNYAIQGFGVWGSVAHEDILEKVGHRDLTEAERALSTALCATWSRETDRRSSEDTERLASNERAAGSNPAAGATLMVELPPLNATPEIRGRRPKRRRA